MAAPEIRICPNCGSRNKQGWEYCARCGEDLHNVPVGESAATVVMEAPDEDEGPSTSWLGLIGPIVAIGLVAYAATRMHRTSGPVRPDPNIFSIPTLPPPTAAARPDPRMPGQDAYEEGLSLFRQGDLAGAARAFARAVGDAPDRGDYHNAYAKALIASDGPAAETIRQFEEAIRLDHGTAAYVVDLARAYDKLGRGDEAAATYARVLEASPGDTNALHELAGLNLRAGRPEAALPYLKRLVAVNPDDLVVQQELGAAAEKAGDREGAKQAYEGVLQKFPQAAVTRGLLAEIFINEGRNNDAVALLRAGVEADPNAALIHRTLASALERTGNVAAAVREYREYARLNPDAPDAKAMADRAARLEARVAQSS